MQPDISAVEVFNEAFQVVMRDVPSRLRPQLQLRVVVEVDDDVSEEVGVVTLRDATPSAEEIFGATGSSIGLDFATVRVGDESHDSKLVLYVCADRVQDLVIAGLFEARLEPTWPICPDHPKSHPLYARLRDETNAEPVWVCPLSEATIALIGELIVNH